MKTVERAHMPSKWWERVRLSSNYAKALEQLDERLIYWPKFLVHKCKQRLTRLTQVNIRMKNIAKEDERLGEKIVPKLAPKIRRREETRERKAMSAAKVERAIERELIERLRSGAYGDRPLNVEEGIWKKVLRGLERAGEGERDVDMDDGEIEEEEEGVGEVEYVSDLDEEEDLEDMEDWLGGDSADSSDYDDDEDESDEDSEDEPPARMRRSLSPVLSGRLLLPRPSLARRDLALRLSTRPKVLARSWREEGKVHLCMAFGFYVIFVVIGIPYCIHLTIQVQCCLVPKKIIFFKTSTSNLNFLLSS